MRNDQNRQLKETNEVSIVQVLLKKYLLYFIVPVMLISHSSCKKDINEAVPQEEISPKRAGRTDISALSVTTEKTIQFSGYTWVVRPSSLTGGPGPNSWSSDNAWVDAAGKLHLKLSKDLISGKWYCAEVYTKNSFGFGKYQFQIEGQIDRLDKNVVLGLFNYSGNDGYDEIDIEFAGGVMTLILTSIMRYGLKQKVLLQCGLTKKNFY